MPAMPEPSPKASASIRPVEMPMAAAMRRFCVTARMRRPKGVARSRSCSATKTRIVKMMIHSRPLVISRPPRRNDPAMKDGAPTSWLLAPKVVRTACCRISEMPQVASSVSSGGHRGGG